MSDYRRDFETAAEYRRRIWGDDRLTVETDIGKVLDQGDDQRLPVKPDSVRSVHRLSIDDQDEWSNRMKNRYGGEW